MKLKRVLASALVAGAALSFAMPSSVNAMSGKNSSSMSSGMNMSKNHHTGKSSSSMGDMNMGGMKMHGSKAPKGLKMDMKAKFKMGSKITIKADHMAGMKGAKGTVVGAYDSKLYTVDFTDTKTHQTIKDHKFLVAQEIKGSHKVGSQVTLEADHMTGMKGAKGKIVAIENGPAYMVNYTPTNNSKMKVTNHKWLAQSELAARK